MRYYTIALVLCLLTLSGCSKYRSRSRTVANEENFVEYSYEDFEPAECDTNSVYHIKMVHINI